jgi:L-2-hydroxyglutarate oxidase LhgO
MRAHSFDFVIVGAGIMGLAFARELKRLYPEQSICIFEKENELGRHASGRNSGVLHSGIYYAPGSLKARVSVEGRTLMTQYCDEYKLPIHRTGKVILPIRDGDQPQLDLLLSRAESNRVRAELLDEQQLKEIEPEARTRTGNALYVPDACVVEPKAILQHIARELTDHGVELRFGVRIEKINPEKSSVTASGEIISFGYFINTAGAYADVVAKSFGLARDYTILPFKGIYFRLSEASGIKIHHLIYPVPDLRFPFLGVHFMRSFQGEIFMGPTVIPAFGRENYSALAGLSVNDTFAILTRLIGQYAHNRQGFRSLVFSEGRRFLRRYFAEAAQAQVPRIRPRDLLRSGKVGIRAQLLNTSKKELVMDFLVERTEKSIHILNAVSPAFTSSFAFARHVLQNTP